MRQNTQMTRYINLCRTGPKKEEKPVQDDDEPTKYEVYKETYQFYNNTDHRKAFMKEYNKNYRQKHSNKIECECGVVYKDISKYAHAKSKRHLAFFENKNKVDT
ncbi:MAG: hypothetical protein NTW61_03020 [Candidatus Melainabacteria bacterium]|nr:hypothetical protein [Candidatus Melainabacteria bacterium]